MTIKICVPIAATKSSDVSALIVKAKAMGADIVEIRLDYLSEEFDKIEAAIKGAGIPLIATNRKNEQGGKCEQNEKERVKKLIDLADRGFSIVDIETTTRGLRSIVSKLKEKGVEVIVSFHDFNRTPNLRELRNIVISQIKAGADICKIVTKADNISDNITCLSLVSQMSQKTRIVCFAMGSQGLLSRILSPIFGGYLTYASLENGMETAPGQISIQHLKEIYKCLGVM